MKTRNQPAPAVRRGFTLFEVLLSITILGIGLAMIGQLVDSGLRASALAKLEAEAVLRAESKMADYSTGIEQFQSVTEREYGDGSDWRWSSNVETGSLDGFYLVRVTVIYPPEGRMTGAQYTLTKMVRDPADIREMELNAQEEESVLP